MLGTGVLNNMKMEFGAFSESTRENVLQSEVSFFFSLSSKDRQLFFPLKIKDKVGFK